MLVLKSNQLGENKGSRYEKVRLRNFRFLSLLLLNTSGLTVSAESQQVTSTAGSVNHIIRDNKSYSWMQRQG